MADVEFPLPKYARVVTELRRRIEEGVYKPGEMLPSEAQLVREFGIDNALKEDQGHYSDAFLPTIADALMTFAETVVRLS